MKRKMETRAKRVKIVRFRTKRIVERTPWPRKCQGRRLRIMEMMPVSMEIVKLVMY